MVKIGLTGGIGSGKSTVAKIFVELGVTVIDADKIVHEILLQDSDTIKKIVSHFGEQILTATGEINRKYVRDLIFQNPEERKWLESLLHPLVYQIMLQRARQAKSPYCVLVIPLLFETKGYEVVDRVLVVESSEELQIKRIVERDRTSVEQVKAIIESQIPSSIRIARANDVVYNNGSLDELRDQVLKLHEKYLQKQQGNPLASK